MFRLLGLGRLARATAGRPNVRVTFSHEVPQSCLENFDSLIRNLKNTRAFITPREFFACYDHGFRPRRDSILMTFDDGRMSSYHAAKTVLNRHGIKAIFFVPTLVLEFKEPRQMVQFVVHNVSRDTLSAGELDETDCLSMDAAALRDLSGDGHMVLPHTHSHVDLKDITDESAVQRELVRPKEILEDLLREPAVGMAFPVGTERQVGAYAYRRIREIYRFCFTALNGANTRRTDPYYIHRDCFPPQGPWAYMDMVMKGVYDIPYRLKMRRLKQLTGVDTIPAPGEGS
jgi:peptidoglycan/xylan/chitin deacetylase (PgdA/CDA1 family)